MSYKLPLEQRRRLCEAAKARYHASPELRLKRINYERARRGVKLITDLSEMGDRKAGRTGAERDERGRFV